MTDSPHRRNDEPHPSGLWLPPRQPDQQAPSTARQVLVGLLIAAVVGSVSAWGAQQAVAARLEALSDKMNDLRTEMTNIRADMRDMRRDLYGPREHPRLVAPSLRKDPM